MYQEIDLISKKNKVSRIINGDKTHILKTYTKAKNMEKEIEVLKFLNKEDVLAPKILKINEKSIVLEDLGERTLLFAYEEVEKNKEDYRYLIQGILSCLKDFYKISEIYYERECILSDMNFRNFIVKDKQIYRIDFEDVDFGEKESDLGKLLAFGLTYSPEYTNWKKDFEREFILAIEASGIYDMESVIAEENLELERIRKRRG